MPLGRGLTIAAVALAGLAAAAARGEDVYMKNGLVYKGTVDKDNTLRQISDGLKRIVVRDSKIARIVPRDSFRRFDAFGIEQPMEVHGGVMPTAALGIAATPWDPKGRREFRYLNQYGKTTKMRQAIISLSPRSIGYRGIDGFWKGNIATSQVPKEVVLGILAKADRKDLTQRLRIASFLMEARWYPDAKVEVESIAKDFPEEKPKLGDWTRSIQDASSRDELNEIGVIRSSRKPKELLARLRAFPGEGVAPEVLAELAASSSARRKTGSPPTAGSVSRFGTCKRVSARPSRRNGSRGSARSSRCSRTPPTPRGLGSTPSPRPMPQPRPRRNWRSRCRDGSPAPTARRRAWPMRCRSGRLESHWSTTSAPRRRWGGRSTSRRSRRSSSRRIETIPTASSTWRA